MRVSVVDEDDWTGHDVVDILEKKVQLTIGEQVVEVEGRTKYVSVKLYIIV